MVTRYFRKLGKLKDYISEAEDFGRSHLIMGGNEDPILAHLRDLHEEILGEDFYKRNELD